LTMALTLCSGRKTTYIVSNADHNAGQQPSSLDI